MTESQSDDQKLTWPTCGDLQAIIDDANSRFFRSSSFIDALRKLTDEQRQEVMAPFCSCCGREHGPNRCQCWNDD